MADAPNRPVVRFGVFELDLAARQLRKNGDRIKLQDQPFRVLQLLLEHPGEVVTREELQEKLWSEDTFVEFDHSLNTDIQKIRQALRDSADSPRFVETVPRTGYRFIAPVERLEPSFRDRRATGHLSDRRVRLAVAAFLSALLVVSVAALWRSRRPASQPLLQFQVAPGPDTWAETRYGANAILSPDGARLVLVASGSNGISRLYTRRLDQGEATSLPGTDGAHSPFFSPDGQWVAFFAGGKLKKTSVRGGAAVTLCDAPNGRGGSWGEDDRIIAALDRRGGLLAVPAAGGTPEPITELGENENSHRWPQVLPGANHVLFTTETRGQGPFDNATIMVQALETGERETLHRQGTYGRYLASEHLVFVRDSTLFAAPFDLGRMRLTGPPSPVLDQVVTSYGFGGAHFDCSKTGMLVYLKQGSEKTIHWMDAAGNLEPLLSTPGRYADPRVAPNGDRLALTVWDGVNPDVWVYGWRRDVMSRLTFAEGYDYLPAWAPDGNHLAYASQMQGGGVYRVSADGSGNPQRLTERVPRESSFSPSGAQLAFVQFSPSTAWDIWTLPIEGSRSDDPPPGKPQPFLQTPFTERTPAFSPDSKWLAYTSDESGTYEVYVLPFPGPGERRQISNSGGVWPVWSPNNRELFYRNLENRIMVVAYSAEGESFTPGKPRLWSETALPSDHGRNFDLAPDGRRFAVVMPAGDMAGQEGPRLTVLLNFFDELHRRVPTGE